MSPLFISSAHGHGDIKGGAVLLIYHRLQFLFPSPSELVSFQLYYASLICVVSLTISACVCKISAA